MQDKDNPSGGPTQLAPASAQQQQDSATGEGVSSDSSVSSQGVSPGKDSPLPPVEPFPVDVLPGPSRQLVEEGAAALGVPPDLVAVPLLAFAGATIGNIRRIQIKLSFKQHPILWAAVVAPPGAAKSPALDLARYPLDVLQQEAQARFTADWKAYKKQGAPKNEGEEPERPQLEHFFSTDATIEAIAAMLTTSPGLADSPSSSTA